MRTLAFFALGAVTALALSVIGEISVDVAMPLAFLFGGLCGYGMAGGFEQKRRKA